jgi:FtsZ-binding cell division protein ZapB
LSSDEANEADLWKERLDDAQVVIEDLREKQATIYARLHRAEDRVKELEAENKSLKIAVERLALHLQQGVEL